MDRILYTGEASARIRRPDATLRWWRHKGIGPKSFKIGGRVAYLESDVESWLAAQYANSTGGAA